MQSFLQNTQGLIQAVGKFVDFVTTPNVAGAQSGYTGDGSVITYSNFTAGEDGEAKCRLIRVIGEFKLGEIPIGFAFTKVGEVAETDPQYPAFTQGEFEAWLTKFYQAYETEYSRLADEIRSRHLDVRAELNKRQYINEDITPNAFRTLVDFQGQPNVSTHTRAIIVAQETEGNLQWGTQESTYLEIDGKPADQLHAMENFAHPLLSEIGMMLPPRGKTSQAGLILPN